MEKKEPEIDKVGEGTPEEDDVIPNFKSSHLNLDDVPLELLPKHQEKIMKQVGGREGREGEQGGRERGRAGREGEQGGREGERGGREGGRRGGWWVRDRQGKEGGSE